MSGKTRETCIPLSERGLNINFVHYLQWQLNILIFRKQEVLLYQQLDLTKEKGNNYQLARITANKVGGGSEEHLWLERTDTFIVLYKLPGF